MGLAAALMLAMAQLLPGGSPNPLFAPKAGDAPEPTHGWVVVEPSLRRAVAAATTLEVFRLGTLSWLELFGCESPFAHCWSEMVRPRWPGWSDRGDWRRDVFGRSSGSLVGILHFPVNAQVKGTASLLSRLRSTLSQGTYGGSNSLCEFEPGVGFRLTSAEGVAELMVCFRCDEAELRVGALSTRLSTARLRGALIALAREAFPDDAVLADLSE